MPSVSLVCSLEIPSRSVAVKTFRSAPLFQTQLLARKEHDNNVPNTVPRLPVWICNAEVLFFP